MVVVCPQCGRPGFSPCVAKIPWRRNWQPTPVFLPEESHGWRSLAGHSQWGCKELDTTERLTHTERPKQVKTFYSKLKVRKKLEQVKNKDNWSISM